MPWTRITNFEVTDAVILTLRSASRCKVQVVPNGKEVSVAETYADDVAETVAAPTETNVRTTRNLWVGPLPLILADDEHVPAAPALFTRILIPADKAHLLELRCDGESQSKFELRGMPDSPIRLGSCLFKDGGEMLGSHLALNGLLQVTRGSTATISGASSTNPKGIAIDCGGVVDIDFVTEAKVSFSASQNAYARSAITGTPFTWHPKGLQGSFPVPATDRAAPAGRSISSAPPSVGP